MKERLGLLIRLVRTLDAVDPASSLAGEVQLGEPKAQLAPKQTRIHAKRSRGGRASHVRARLEKAPQVAKYGQDLQADSPSTNSDRLHLPRPALNTITLAVRRHVGCLAMISQMEDLELVSNFRCVS